MLVSGAVPLIASLLAAPVCVGHNEDCVKTAHLKGCCGGEQGDPHDGATPPAGKTLVAQPVAEAIIGVTGAPLVAPGLLRSPIRLTTASSSSPPDLITLFGAFLI